MTSKYIKRKWTDHAQSTEYLSDEDEYIKIEIFSFDPVFTKTFSAERNTLTGENVTKTNFESLPCFKSKDKINLMEFTLNYKVTENGEYRVDLLYMKHDKMYSDEKNKLYNTSKDLTGWYDIYKAESKKEHTANVLASLPKNASKAMQKAFEKTQKLQLANANANKTSNPDTATLLKFEGENNILKRKTIFKRLDKGDWKFEFAVPHNCYVIGAIIRKIQYYSGSNNDEPGSNLQFTHAKTTNSEMGKPVELEATIGYDNAFDCEGHRSGLYMEYMDECNVYVKDHEDKIVQWFGGYIATPLVDKDMEEISIHCSDRLYDGENKYILDQLMLQNGDGSESQYSKNNQIHFNRHSDVLKYLCRLYENTLHHNITKNFKSGVEKYQDSFIISYGSKKNVKKIPVNNGQVKVNKNSVTLRNNASSSKKQVFTVFNSKKGVNISKYGNGARPVNLHIHYGLGDVKTEHKEKNTITVDAGGEVAGSQKFSKCGVSHDKKYVMGIGQRSVGKSAKTYPDGVYFESIFENKCPYCHEPTLRWDSCRSDTKCIFNHGRSGTKRKFPVPANETEITCENCDCDFDIATGYSKEGKYKYKLKKVGSTKKSSKARQTKLHKGEMVASAGKNTKITPGDIFKAIKNACKGWRHDTGTGTTASYLEKHHVGDCWAWSDWISKQLKKYKVNNKIVQYKSGSSDQHRSVLYQNSKGEYVDFPYRKYGFPQGTYNTKGSKNGSKKGSYTAGGRINQASASGSNTRQETKEVTVTQGYDKDKPFQAYLDIKFSFGKTGKKHHVYVDFTQQAISNYSISGLKPVWINNASTELTLKGIVQTIQKYYNNTSDVYLHSLSFIAPKVKAKQGDKNTQWYTNDENTRDNSSCKIILYSISFDNQDGTEPADLQATGKSINEVMKSTIETANYIMNMDYATHRCNDKINFNINSNSNPVFTATEGDKNNILEWGNISYDPANQLYNMSRCVYLNRVTNNYSYVSSKDIESILNFQEQCTLLTENEAIGAKEAYWNARHNEKFNPYIVYNYTVTVKGAVNVNLKDLVEVVSDAKQLNTLKEVESVSLEYNYKDKPVLQTELGLGELAPDLQLRKTIKNLRDSAKKKTTYFDSSAEPVHDEDIYEWEY